MEICYYPYKNLDEKQSEVMDVIMKFDNEKRKKQTHKLKHIYKF